MKTNNELTITLAAFVAVFTTFVVFVQPTITTKLNTGVRSQKRFFIKNQVKSNIIDYKFKSPLIFIPGNGGSQIEAKINKTTRVHYVCAMQSDWFDIWLNIHLLTPVLIDCLIDNLQLYYDNLTHTTHNTNGVEIRVTKFGSIESVEYLDIIRLPKTDYFYNLVDYLVRKNLYKRNEDVFSAPYDFRKAPNELQDFFINFSNLITKAYADNGNRPVTLICHSMGCLNTVYLLNKKSQGWKDIYIKRLIALAAPWSGSVQAINALLFGENFGIPLLNKTRLQTLQISFPSLMYLLPVVPTFDKQRVLIQTPDMNYTLDNFGDFFGEMNMTNQLDMWKNIDNISESIRAPGVELWCIHGTGTETTSKIIFFQPSFDGKYLKETSDGDGTVNIESLEACANFSEGQDKPVRIKKFKNLNHIQIIRSKDVSDFISRSILSCDDPNSRDCAFKPHH